MHLHALTQFRGAGEAIAPDLEMGQFKVGRRAVTHIHCHVAQNSGDNCLSLVSFSFDASYSPLRVKSSVSHQPQMTWTSPMHMI